LHKLDSLKAYLFSADEEQLTLQNFGVFAPGLGGTPSKVFPWALSMKGIDFEDLTSLALA